MNNDIKEILDTFKELTEDYSASSLLDFEGYEIPCIQLKMILDYITNLQEHLEISKDNAETYRLEMQEITKIFGLDEHTLFDDVKEYATNLQEENFNYRRLGFKHLCDKNKKLEEENKILKENAEHNDKVVDKAKWNEMLCKQRIDKAIEYIESYNLPEDLGYFGEAPMSIRELRELLNILNGSDENE